MLKPINTYYNMYTPPTGVFNKQVVALLFIETLQTRGGGGGGRQPLPQSQGGSGVVQHPTDGSVQNLVF